MDASRQDDENREALSHHRNFTSTIDSITASICHLPNVLIKTRLSDDVKKLQDAADGLSEFLSARLPPIHYNEIRSQDAQIAKCMFLIPELLELVLEYVDVVDILTMRQVNKGVQAIIDVSPKLQIKLYYRAIDEKDRIKGKSGSPFSSGFYKTPLETGFQVEVNTHKEGLPVVAGLYRVKAAQDLPRIGRAWKRMFICQPPVLEMYAFTDCSVHGRVIPGVEVTSTTGLTVGDLHDQAAKMLTSENCCGLCKARESSRRFFKKSAQLDVIFYAPPAEEEG